MIKNHHPSGQGRQGHSGCVTGWEKGAPIYDCFYRATLHDEIYNGSRRESPDLILIQGGGLCIVQGFFVCDVTRKSHCCIYLKKKTLQVFL